MATKNNCFPDSSILLSFSFEGDIIYLVCLCGFFYILLCYAYDPQTILAFTSGLGLQFSKLLANMSAWLFAHHVLLSLIGFHLF